MLLGTPTVASLWNAWRGSFSDFYTSMKSPDDDDDERHLLQQAVKYTSGATWGTSEQWSSSWRRPVATRGDLGSSLFSALLSEWNASLSILPQSVTFYHLNYCCRPLAPMLFPFFSSVLKVKTPRKATAFQERLKIVGIFPWKLNSCNIPGQKKHNKPLNSACSGCT